MGAGQGRKQVGAQGGVPLPPFFQHQRAASPPRGARTPPSRFVLRGRARRPQAHASHHLLPLCFPSGEFFPPPSFLAVSWPSRSFLVTGQVGDSPQNRRLGAPRCQAGVGGLARLTLRGVACEAITRTSGRLPSSPGPAQARGFGRDGSDSVLQRLLLASVSERSRSASLRGGVGASRNHVLWEPNSFSFPAPNF